MGDQWQLRLYRKLLGAVPTGFRTRFAPAMEETFADGLAVRHGLFRSARFLVRSYLGVVRVAVVERLMPSFSESHHRRHGGENVLKTTFWNFSNDIRLSIRSLRRQPAFALVAVFTIALGVGANSAIFSVIKGVLLEPLPFNEPQRLIRIGAYDWNSAERIGSMSMPDIVDISDLESIESFVGYREGTAAITGDGDPAIISVARVTEGLLATYGLTPLLGRDLRRDEYYDGSPLTVVVSYSFWQNQLGGNPDVLGMTVQLAERDWEIVGVAPPGFEEPVATKIWRPFHNNPEGCARGCHFALGIGRIATGFTLENVKAETRTLSATLSEEFPESNFEKGFAAVTLKEQIVGDFRTGLMIVLGAVGVVLLITCTNIAILLMVRSSARESEMAVRAALGAGRRRLFTQMLMESQVLAMVGGVVGLGIAFGAIKALKLMSPGTIPRLDAVSVDGGVLLFTIVSSVFVAFFFGLAPAVNLSRFGISSGLLTGGRSASGRRSENRMRSALLAAEVAMSLVLLAGSGLLLKTFQNMYEIDLGFETRGILRARLSLPSSRYDTLEKISAFYTELENRIEGLPGVEAVGSGYGPPLGRGNITGEVQVAGRELPPPGSETHGTIRAVSPSYLGTMRIPVLNGRGLERTDRDGNTPVAVVNETFVRENFPDEDPIGQSVYITATFGFADPTWQIVGVVRDINSASLTGDPVAEIYVPHSQFGPGALTVSVRYAGSVAAITPALRDLIREMDPSLPVRQFETLEQAISREVAPTKFYLLLLGAFAGLALILASVGLYGVVAYLVSQRVRELGIRLALGAAPSQILTLVMSQGLRPAVWGIVIGTGMVWAGARALESLLYGVAPRDPVVLASVAGLLFVVSALAIFVPARRAAAVNPVEVMRSE